MPEALKREEAKQNKHDPFFTNSGLNNLIWFFAIQKFYPPQHYHTICKYKLNQSIYAQNSNFDESVKPVFLCVWVGVCVGGLFVGWLVLMPRCSYLVRKNTSRTKKCPCY